ncbi:Nn.00g116370.m01.CDS01 [Neocucurbitaria sp. VM-36]
MCHKLIQLYACGHSKTICRTPCPHAIDTARQVTHLNGNHDSVNLSRSSSVISSIAPSMRRSDLHDLPSQLRSQAQHSPGQPLPLRMRSLSRQPAQTPPLAFHFVPPSQNPLLSAPPGYAQPSPTSPTAPSPTSTFSRNSNTSPSVNHFPENEEHVGEPDYCSYHFPRYLPQSRRPCLQCYVQPEWEDMPKAWMRMYKETHPYVKEEDVERLSGIAELRERMGMGMGQ